MTRNHSAHHQSTPLPLHDMLRLTYHARLRALQEFNDQTRPVTTWGERLLTRPSAALLRPAPSANRLPLLLQTPVHGRNSPRLFCAEIDALMANYSDSPETCHQFMGRLQLRFAHLSKDQREVYEIPEVVQYFRALNQQWPYWLHFLAPERDNMALLMLLLGESAADRADAQTVRRTLLKTDQLHHALVHLIEATVNLQQTCGLDAQVCIDHGRQVLDAMKDALSPLR